MKKTIFVIFLVFILAMTVFAGVEWRARTLTQSETKGQSNTIVMQIYAAGGNVKQVFESVAYENEMFQKGSYWLFKAADSTLYLVNPAEKTYSLLPMNAMMQLAGVVGKLVKIKIKNPVVESEKLGVETVMGYPCQHSKLLMEYDMEVKIAIIKSKSHEKIEKEVWADPQVQGHGRNGRSLSFPRLQDRHGGPGQPDRAAGQGRGRIGFSSLENDHGEHFHRQERPVQGKEPHHHGSPLAGQQEFSRFIF